jgi:ATP-binding cassette, subfamily B (MDR/TAP), member 1
MQQIAIIVSMVAITIFVFSYIQYAFFEHLAESITTNLKKKYIASLFRQEIGYFEVNKVEQIPSTITEIFDTLHSSIGEKVANLIFALTTCLASICYGLYFGWKFTLVCAAYLPLLLGFIAVFGRKV